MKKTAFIFLLTFSSISFAQQNAASLAKATNNNQNDSPKYGEIVFIEQASIYDTVAYETSKENFINQFIAAMKERVKREPDSLKKETDTMQLKMLISFMKNNMETMLFDEMFSEKNKKYHYIKLLDSLVVSYEKVNDKIKGDYYVKNIHENSSYWLAKIDSLTTSSRRKLKPYKEQKISNLKEDGNDIKMINGYKCFKVSFETEEKLDEMLILKSLYEMYVTDKIKLLHHPVFKIESILTKYYPLEIFETPMGIEGARIEYILSHLKL